jgi:chemotaxis methyl-accepting protein methylase
MDDDSLRRLLEHFHLSWQGYRKVRKGVKKRIVRHMHALNLTNVEDYLRVLQEDIGEEEKARRLFSVTISRFFRDRHMWDAIASTVLPDLLETCPAAVKVWSAGCARGEEVYSLKILWLEMMDRGRNLPQLEIWATDMDPVTLEKARLGKYHESSLREVNVSLREKYFLQRGECFVVSQRLRQDIHWKVSDLVDGKPPGTSFDCVFLRNNLLTYHAEGIKTTALLKVIGAIRWGGYLIVGNSEKLPPVDIPMKQCPEYRSIQQKSKAGKTEPGA